MPFEKTNEKAWNNEVSMFQDDVDTFDKCHAMIQLITEKQKKLERSEKSTIQIYLSAEQLEFLEGCVNDKLISVIDFYDDEDEDEEDYDDED